MPTTTTTQAVVWAEIPVTDLERAIPFYEAVLEQKLTINNAGPNPMADFAFADGSVGGHLYPGVPAPEGTGATIHLGVASVEQAAERVTQAGGKILGPIVAIPVGRFQYAIDLDGNSLGLFEYTTS